MMASTVCLLYKEVHDLLWVTILIFLNTKLRIWHKSQILEL